jgi:hypothetical protein
VPSDPRTTVEYPDLILSWGTGKTRRLSPRRRNGVRTTARAVLIPDGAINKVQMFPRPLRERVRVRGLIEYVIWNHPLLHPLPSRERRIFLKNQLFQKVLNLIL